MMLFYNLPAFAEKDADAFLSALARASGLIRKVSYFHLLCTPIVCSCRPQGGVLDTIGASRILLRDWSTGKFPRFTLPPSTSTSMAVDSPFSDIYASDEGMLDALPTRKERRKTDGVVKLVTSEPETRKLALETPWFADHEENDEDEA